MEIYEKGKEEIILIMITDVVDCFIVRSVYSVIDSMQHLRPIKIPITIFQKIILANSYLESKGEAISNYYLLPCQSPHLHLRNQLQLAGVLLGSWNCQAYKKKNHLYLLYYRYSRRGIDICCRASSRYSKSSIPFLLAFLLHLQ